MKRPHKEMTDTIHNHAPIWTGAMPGVPDEMLREYLESFEEREDTPHVRVWKRIVVLEARRRWGPL